MSRTKRTLLIVAGAYLAVGSPFLLLGGPFSFLVQDELRVKSHRDRFLEVRRAIVTTIGPLMVCVEGELEARPEPAEFWIEVPLERMDEEPEVRNSADIWREGIEPVWHLPRAFLRSASCGAPWFSDELIDREVAIVEAEARITESWKNGSTAAALLDEPGPAERLFVMTKEARVVPPSPYKHLYFGRRGANFAGDPVVGFVVHPVERAGDRRWLFALPPARVLDWVVWPVTVVAFFQWAGAH